MFIKLTQSANVQLAKLEPLLLKVIKEFYFSHLCEQAARVEPVLEVNSRLRVEPEMLAEIDTTLQVLS